MMLRILSFVFFAAAAARLVFDWNASIGLGERFEMALVGDVWFRVHPGSLQLIQPVIERYISVWLWDSVVAPFTLTPLAPILAGFAVVFWLLARRKRKQQEQ